jgi:hypothetical protein
MSEKIEVNQELVPSLSKSGILVVLNISTCSGRKLDKQVSAEVAEQKRAKSAKVGNYTKHLFAGCKEIDDLVNHAAKWRNWHREQTLPWDDYNNTRLLTTANFFNYQTGSKEYKDEFEALKRKLDDVYDTPGGVIERQLFKLQELGERGEFPSRGVILDSFSYNISFTPVPVLHHFSGLELAIQNEVAEQLDKANKEREVAMSKDLWDRLEARLRHLGESIEAFKKEGGTRFHETSISHLTSLCELLTRLNISGDPALEARRKEVEGLLVGLKAKGIRKSEGLRTDIKQKVDDILKKMGV